MHQHLQHQTCSLKSTIKYALINGKLFGIIDVTINRPRSAGWLSQQCFSLTSFQHQPPAVFFSHNKSASATSQPNEDHVKLQMALGINKQYQSK
jgi:hypothetical protein